MYPIKHYKGDLAIGAELTSVSVPDYFIYIKINLNRMNRVDVGICTENPKSYDVADG